MGDIVDRNLTAGELRHEGDRSAHAKRVEELLREAVSDGRGERVNAGAYWLAERLVDCERSEQAEAQVKAVSAIADERLIRLEQAEAERIRLEVTCDALMQLLKAAEAERDSLKAELRAKNTPLKLVHDALAATEVACDAALARLAAVREYAEDRELVGVPVEGFAGAILALLDGEPRRGP